MLEWAGVLYWRGFDMGLADSVERRVLYYRFGPFQLDVKTGEMRKHGTRVRLREQPFRILLLLLEHNGEIVPREEIRQKLWPNDTVVEYDPNINAAVKKLRDVLGDSAEKPRYIETLARRGYRFLAEIETVRGEGPEDSPAPALASFEITAGVEGESFSHYRVLGKLGSGGMGVVFRAEDLALHRLVALKFLSSEYSRHPQLLQRFQREARAAAALNHPNICTVYEIGEYAGRPYIAMELLAGQTIKDRLTTERFEVGEVLSLAVQITDALDAAHSQGIIHRDIKPANLFVTSRGHAKVLDFGLAKLAPDYGLVTLHRPSTSGEGETPKGSMQMTTPGAPMGTAAYMSPEQARGEVVDQRTDLFSLGIVVYEMLGGKQPFTGHSTAEVIEAIEKQDPAPLPRSVPPALERMVRRCLEKDRENRFQAAADLGAALRSLSITGTPAKAPLRHPWGKWAAGAAAGIMAAAAIYWLGARSAESSFSEVHQWDAVQVSRLTATGQVQDAAISPDGRFVVYATGGVGQTNLRLRNLISGVDSEIGAVEGLRPGLAVSPKGDEIYFIRGPEWAPGTLFRIPVNGGLPVEAAAGANSPPSFSPTGDEFAFARSDNATGEDQIVIARTGGKQRILARSRFPFFVMAPVWSPVDDTVAYVGTPEKYFHMALLAHGANRDAPARQITPADWYRIGSLVWINHGSALLMEGQGVPNAEHQIWKVSYPEGRAKRITADLNSYHGLSVASDSNLLIALRTESQWQILMMQTGSANPEENMQPLAGASPSGDGADGLAFSSDGRLVFSSNASGMNELWVMDADGTHKEQITRNDSRNMRPSLSRDGRVLVCTSTRGGGHDIWRMSSDGTNARQLTTSGADSQGTLSPDGTWIAYMSMGEGRRWLRRMDIDGNHQTNLSDKPMLPEAPVISPDGQRVAFLTYNPAEHANQIVVIPSGGGAPIKTANVPRSCALQWTPSGDAVAYLRSENGAQNIWAVPWKNGAAHQVTHFRQGLIDRFAWSSSGKQLAIVRRNSTGDAVLIRPAIGAGMRRRF